MEEAYENIVPGKLKLKAKALPTKEFAYISLFFGIKNVGNISHWQNKYRKKKKKKKGKKDKKRKKREESEERSKKQKVEEPNEQVEENPVEEIAMPITDTRTEAEKKFDLIKKERQTQKIEKMAEKSYRDKLKVWNHPSFFWLFLFFKFLLSFFFFLDETKKDYNSFLDKLSEHHDIPKVGPG